MLKSNYRVFTKHLGWGECMYLFSEKTSYKEIKEHPGTWILNKSDFIGNYLFDDKFLSYFQKMTINGETYFIKMSYDNDIKEEKEESLF